MADTFTQVVNYSGSETRDNIQRSYLKQDALAAYFIPWNSWRVWDAYGTLLPATSGTDDLGLYGGTFATSSPAIRTGDVKTTTVTRYARTSLVLPPEYDPGETITLRLYAGMLTTAADTSATVDCQCYKSNNATGIGSDLVTTSAVTINSTSFANRDFTVTPTNLVPGDIFDMRVTIAIVDAATGTVVEGCIGAAYLLLDIKG